MHEDINENDNVATLRNFANKADSGRECAMGTASADDLANIRVELRDAVAIVHLARSAKRNALNDETVFLLERWFSRPPEQVKAVVSSATGDHFCAGPRSLGTQGAQRRRRRVAFALLA